MELADRTICTGCGTCAKACPQHAIEFHDDEEGFPTPFIKKEECIECGLCNKVCPAIHMPETHSVQTAYAVQITDQDALKDSTSGGLFTAFSREIFRRGGVVYGCVWDEDYNAIIKKAESEAEFLPMRGSKYVWSWAGDTFPEIKVFLEAGRTVLFTGLPCQVAGLKNYMRKDYENLYLLDFLCSGTPSPLAFQSWLKTICPSGDLAGLGLKFRDKDPYGVGVHISYAGKKGKPKGEHISNSYYYSFYTKLVDRRSCFNCPYRSTRRLSDLTMSDYWGIKNYHSEFDVRAGVSALLINTEKGVALLNSIKDQVLISETELEYVAAANSLIMDGQRKGFHVPPFREVFFETIKNDGWKAAEKKYLYNKTRLKLWIKTKIPSKYYAVIRRIARGR